MLDVLPGQTDWAGGEKGRGLKKIKIAILVLWLFCLPWIYAFTQSHIESYDYKFAAFITCCMIGVGIIGVIIYIIEET